MEDENKVVWISWQYHRRTAELVKLLGIPWVKLEGRGAVKYIHLPIKTFIKLYAIRPRVLIVQNPSMVLTILAIALKCIFKYKLIVDAHNIGVYFFPKGILNYNLIYKIVHSWTDVTIVSNAILAEKVAINGGYPLVLPDLIPDLGLPSQQIESDKIVVVYICSFSPDEPVDEFCEACLRLPDKFTVYITGNYKKANIHEKYLLSEKLHFTGFLDEAEYIALLKRARFVVDLTTMHDCLVCGAYEAVSLSTPVVLSDTVANRTYFVKGVVYTEHDTDDLVRNMLFAVENEIQLKSEIVELKAELKSKWMSLYNKLVQEINHVTCQ